MTDKRQYQRVTLNVTGELSHHTTSVPITVMDISLQGLRLSVDEKQLEALPFDSHDPYTVVFQANSDSPYITAHLQQLYRHHHPRYTGTVMGCKVDHIDVESLASLRRMIQLNSKDASLSDMDLEALIDNILKAGAA